MKIRTGLLRKAIGILPIVAAVALVAVWVRNKPEPAKKPVAESARVLRVIETPKVDLLPRVIGFGVAEPGEIWNAVAEVKGRIRSVHPELKSGSRVRAGTVLLEIDPTEYELAVARLAASIDQSEAQLAELDAQGESSRASLAIEERSLGLAEQSLERVRKAVERNALSADELDREQRTVLAQHQSIQNHKNTLRLLPSQRRALEATLAANRAQLRQAELDLSKVTIQAPFDCRVGAVNLQVGQYLAAGQNLFEALGTAVTEVEARFRIEQLRSLLGPLAAHPLPARLDKDVARHFASLKATVRLGSGDWSAEWDARVDRVREEVDPQTRTFSVVVAVDRPYDQMVVGRRPPLTRGMFCEVELQGPELHGAVLVPRSAVHGDTVYILDGQRRLTPVPVTLGPAQSGFVRVLSGLAGGETLVVSDPTPAITGMLVEPVEDDALRARLVAEARAEANVR